jgi:hypothetical protein
MLKKIVIVAVALIALIVICISLIVGAYLPFPDFYIKSVCKDSHFSCEQNMSLGCRRDGICIN